MSPKSEQLDIVISGGGIAGCLAAIALSQSSNYTIGIIEPQKPQWQAEHPSFDARVIALADESWNILERFNVDHQNVSKEPIKRITVSDRRHFGQTVLDAKELGLQNFGKVVHLSQLGKALYTQLKDTSVTFISEQSISSILKSEAYLTINTQNKVLETKLLVIAEGTQSTTRDKLNLANICNEYNQVAMIANIETQIAHQGQAFERFSQHGPIALLPLPSAHSADASHFMSLVWCTSTDKYNMLRDVITEDFESELQRLFGDRLGELKLISDRYHYPLSLQSTVDEQTHRAVCIANASQTLHPIAGQGFNLGIRDINDLYESLKVHDAGSYQQVRSYHDLRRQDKANTINATDFLVRVFSNHSVPFIPLRSIFLNLLNMQPSLKKGLAKFAMGQR